MGNLSVYTASHPLIMTSDEMLLLLCCARLNLSVAGRLRIEELCSSVDWSQVIELAQWHGMNALLHHRLHEVQWFRVPNEHRKVIVGRAKASKVHQLLLTSHLLKVHDALRNANINVLHWKGITLDHLLYGGKLLRLSGDMDILIRKTDVLRVKSVLAGLGYQPLFDLSKAGQESELIRLYKDYVFINKQTNHKVEVHWSLMRRDVSTNFDWAFFKPKARAVCVGGKQLETFGPEDLMLSLCMHGARHRFERLKWLCDIGQMIEMYPLLNWDLIREQSRAQSVERMSLLSAHLVDKLLQVKIPTGLEESISGNAKLHRLGIEVTNGLTDISDGKRPLSRIPFELSLLDSLSARIRYFFFLAISPNTQDVPVPNSSFIYGAIQYISRILSIIRRRGPMAVFISIRRLIGSLFL